MSDKWVSIWVPAVRGPGYVEPDLPREDLGGGEFRWLVPFRMAPDGAPRDMVNPTEAATEYFNVLVKREDVQKVTSRVPEGRVSERDKLLIKMLRECAGKYESEAAGFFGRIKGIDKAADNRKRGYKDVLVQAVARGLSPKTAESIRVKHRLPKANRRGH